MKQYHVYILLCADGSYYTGFTNDIDRRFIEHTDGLNKDCYTFKRRPLKLVFAEPFPDINQAIAFEKQIKGWRRAKKEALKVIGAHCQYCQKLLNNNLSALRRDASTGLSMTTHFASCRKRMSP